MTRQPLKILFVLLHPGYARNYESTIRLLLDRGHRIHLGFSLPGKQASDHVAERLASAYPGLTFSTAPKRESDGWRQIVWAVRALMDYARYLHPRYADARLLRERVAEKIQAKAPKFGLVTRLVTVGFTRIGWPFTNAHVANLLVSFFMRLESGIPPSSAVERFVIEHDPDVVLVTPVVNIGASEVEYVKVSRRLGIPSGVCVASWDNLSNKGLVRVEPDRVFVWNATQVAEAVQMHRLPSTKIVMTGAQRFDEWFEAAPSRRRDEFCEAADLDPNRPFVLYLCSSPFIAPAETGFVARWIAALRSDPDLADYGILIRPHPQNVAQWLVADFDGVQNVSIWPRAGAQPVDVDSKRDFFESVYYCSAVVGINTSALIEAAIVGRSVLTVLDAEFAGTQEGTLHFHYLLHENGGFLHVASDLDDHRAQLRAVVAGADEHRAQTEAFVASFVRPFGLTTPSTPRLADAIEELARMVPGAAGRSTGDRIVATALAVTVEAARITSWVRRAARRGGRTPKRAVLRSRQAIAAASRRSALWPLAWVRSPLARRKGRASGLAGPLRRFLGDDLTEAKLEALSRSKGRAPENAAVREVRKTIGTLRRSRAAAVVLGPWLGEPATELLYWIPFLRHVVQKQRLEPSRLVAVSHGGVKAWYRGLSTDYVDLADRLPSEDLASYTRLWSGYLRKGAHADMKRLETAALGASSLSGDEITALSPRLLQQIFGTYWRGRGALRPVLPHLAFDRIKAPGNRQLEKVLPARYVAVDPTVGLREAIASAAAQESLVALATSDEWEARCPGVDASTPLDSIRLTRRIGARSAIIGRAHAYIGGLRLAPVALSHRVPCVALLDEESSFRGPDLDLAFRMAWQLDVPFYVLTLDQLSHAAAVARAVMAPMPAVAGD
jgi:hypothetical protein